MRVFWSWQSDTPGKTGRHFVRAVLNDAIKALKEPEDVDEPSERDIKQALHLDHDRKGVPGSPDLAPTIFRKITDAAVFIADVSLSGSCAVAGTDREEQRVKKLVNSNVAIEYGYALHALGDDSILMVQNTHYGNREELPFDLKHKAGPIQYRLAPEAAKEEIETMRRQLRGQFIEALRPYIARASARRALDFAAIPSTSNAASFRQKNEVLATLKSVVARVLGHNDSEEAIEYRFDETRAFYLRLRPMTALAEQLAVNTLMSVVDRRRIQVLTRTVTGGMPGRNRFGGILYETHGDSVMLTALTQLFRNGEIWGVSAEFGARYQGAVVVPMANVGNIFPRVLNNYIEVAKSELGIAPPYQIDLGAVGLRNMRVSLPPGTSRDAMSEPIYENELRINRIIDNPTHEAINSVVTKFVTDLYDLAAVTT